ncbi:MAG: methyltransferase domain-containing protein [Deltaproteobacteria bacterium]|nr:methyltransferase domain-containing protein [Deltaproteobacteria bacterium]
MTELRKKGCQSVLDYGAGGGHTTLLAYALGFRSVFHHEFKIFHPFVQWRAQRMAANDNFPQPPDFIFSAAEQPMPHNNIVDGAICTDVVEHVPDPNILLDQLRNALTNGGYLMWVATFIEAISCHINIHYAGHEEELLNRHGFHRIEDFPVHYNGHTGIYQLRK